MKFIKDTEPLLAGKSIIGGKATNLFRLKGMGMNVPKWLVLPQDILESLISPSLAEEGDYKKIIECISSAKIESPFIEKILSYFSDSSFLAIRSSAMDEDGSEFSFAGQFESYLFVTKENLEASIKKVWQSAFSERVFQYRANNHLKQNVGIAVIVQEMIDTESAGVAFSANPTNGDLNEKVISAVFGLGEGLVSGELNSDNFIVKEKKISRSISDKTHKIVFNSENSGGTRIVEVEKDKIKMPCLSDKQIHEIENVLEICQKEYSKPMDIEFGIAKNKIYLFQARPVTGLNKVAGLKGEYIVWDNSNIIESYPGVTTPLTFSFIIKMYEAVYRQFADIMGVSQKDIDENADVFANMLGLIKGRVYYNLLSWYKALSLLPGYSINAEFMEKMMGVKERFELKDVKRRTKFRERLRVLNLIYVMLKNLHALPSMRIKFQEDFNKTMKTYEAMDLNSCRPEELMKLYLAYEQTLLKKWKAPLVNDFFAMIYFGVLQKLVVKYKISENTNIGNDLLCGAKDIISTEPVHRTLVIAASVMENSETKNIFLNKDELEILKELERKDLSGIKFHIEEYIKKFGERCVGELKLETITYKQNPAAFIKIIKSYVQQGISKLNPEKNIEDQLRTSAEKKVALALRTKPIKKMIFQYFLRHARTLVSERENLRFERTRGFGMVRQIFCAIGNNFYAEAIIASPRDIFYLTKEEIFDFIKGTSVNHNLKKLIGLRKEEFAAYEKEKAPERIHTYGMVYHGNDFNQKPRGTVIKGDLKGIGCCPGHIKAKVRVVTDPNEVENLNGDILVTSSTDPGWVTLFPTASGILVERGSLLSHSAIVSREMGKPCIVGITGLLDVLKSGDIVEMDGSTGEIKIIEKHERKID